MGGWWIPETVVEGRHPVEWRRKGLPVIDMVMRMPGRRGTVIQAGGHLGLWPLTLVKHFARVVTFEPDEENYACMRKNIAERDTSRKIEIHYGALGDINRTASIKRGPTTGSHYVKVNNTSGSCPMFTIDSLGLSVDALFLDVEGYEVFALRGAMEMIRRDKPIIVCEENKCGERYGFAHGDIEKQLAPVGYRIAARRKKDIILSC